MLKKEIPILSSYFKMFWTPAFAGVTLQETFYETIFIASYNYFLGVRWQAAKAGRRERMGSGGPGR
jgi:hypothetical protein